MPDTGTYSKEDTPYRRLVTPASPTISPHTSLTQRCHDGRRKKQMTARMKLSQRQGQWSPHYLSPSHAFGPFLGPLGFFAAPPGPTSAPCAHSGPPGQLCRDLSPRSSPNHGDDKDSSAEDNK
ncbi:homeobox protein DLX-4-like [Ixodes scapularis]